MQDLTRLLGSTLATQFLSALASGYRRPVFRLQALAEDQITVLCDFTPDPSPNYFLRSVNLDFRDDGSAASASFVIANNDGRFDRYGDGIYGSPYDDPGNPSGPQQPIIEDRILRFQKGLVLDGVGSVFIPAFYGRVTHVGGNYERMGEQVFNVSCVDQTKHILKRKATTANYVNWNVNSIASDILRRYGGFVPAYVAAQAYAVGMWTFDPATLLTYQCIAAVSYVPGVSTPAASPASDGTHWTQITRPGIANLWPIPPTFNPDPGTGAGAGNYYQVQFPDMGILEMIQDLYSPLIFLPRCDEAGNFITRPMIGSPGGIGAGTAYQQLGFPDCSEAQAPTPQYIIPDSPLIQALDPTWQDHDFVNQIRVLGQAANLSSGQSTNTLQALGPFSKLYTLPNTQVSPNDYAGQVYTYGGGTGGQNSLLAETVITRMQYSTNHGGTNSAFVYFSFLSWRGAWVSGAPNPYTYLQQRGGKGDDDPSVDTISTRALSAYSPGDVVTYSGSYYLCVGTPSSTDVPNVSTGWQVLILPDVVGGVWDGPWFSPTNVTIKPGTSAVVSGQPFYIYNSGNQQCGYIYFNDPTVAYIFMAYGGIQFTGSSGEIHGGFQFNWEIWGSPVLNNSNALSAYADYNPVTVVQEQLPAYGSGQDVGDVFDDHITYQLGATPLAMSGTVEVWESTDGGMTKNSLGQIRADGTILTGTQFFKVDWEQGRIVLVSASYQVFAEDDGGSNIYSAYPSSFPGTPGGQGTSTGFGSTANSYSGPAINTESLANNTMPSDLWTHYREGVASSTSNWQQRGDIVYVIPGLSVGQSYNLLMYFAEPNDTSSTQVGQRVFDVYANGIECASALDVYGQAGSSNALMIETDGIATDTDGNIVIVLTQIQQSYISNGVFPQTQSSGDLAHAGDAQYNGNFAVDPPIIFGIEVQNPTEPGADVLAIDCGGPGIDPATPPIFYASYSYSPVQQTYGIQYDTIDNPLIATQALADQVAGYWCDRRAWERFTTQVKCASIPMIQPGDVIQFYHPPLNADFIVYIPEIQRDSERTADGSGGSDMDTYTVQILFVSYRGSPDEIPETLAGDPV